MDDATASDNCGEVTIECQRDHGWRPTTSSFARCDGRCGNSVSAAQTITVDTPS